MPTDFRILLLTRFEVFLSYLSEFLIYHFGIFSIAYSITQSPPCFIHPQLSKMIVATHIARFYLRYSMNDLEYMSYVEEIQELIRRRLHTLLEKLIEL